MVGESQSGQFGSQDWINKASPDELITHATKLFGRIGQLDQTYRDQFVSKLKADPAAAKMLETMTPA